MALRTTIPTLEIKTSGTDLSLVETLYITIKQGDFQTAKSNDDIEVDNDIISVVLSQSEAAQFNATGGASIAILAVGYDGESHTVGIEWAKRGSRTDYGSGGGSGGGGGTLESNMAWYPNVSEGGDLSWYKTESEIPPETVNIKGEQGEQGEPGIPGSPGAKGDTGEDGFSPIIEPNEENTDDSYKLDITTSSGEFTTPNLKGQNGNNGSDGFSPEITENEDNTSSVYKLDITTADSTFTTPNLIGQSGSSGVTSFNRRTGNVAPQTGDYTAEMVGAATMEQVNTAIQAAILESWESEY